MDPGAEEPFRDLIDRYIGWLRYRGLSELTVTAYVRELKALDVATDQPLSELKTQELAQYLEAKGGAAATRARRLAALRSFYGWLVRIEAREGDPTARLDRPKVPEGLPKPLADPETVFATLDPQTRLIAVFLRETGLRISEACSIDITPPVPDFVVVQRKGNKGRPIPLTEKAREALNLLGGSIPIGVRAVQRRFKAAGFTPHRLRHTFGCELAASDADLGEMQDLLGHASPATTRVYTLYAQERLRRALNRRDSRRPPGRP